MKNPNFYSIIFLIIGILGISACEKLEPAAPAESDILDGPIEGLSPAQSKQFLAGDIAFNDEIFTAANGLGPSFVATSCGSCHIGDGKGHPFTTLIRFGQSAPGKNSFLDKGGPQLQNRAIPGFEPEQLPDNAAFSKFTPPANTGLGFLELVSDADILELADPEDANGDGISGVPNWKALPPFITPTKNAIEQNGQYIHRFGKKAAAYNLLHQTVNAYSEDMGVASFFIPTDVYSHQEIDPEVSNQTVFDVVFYLQTLKAPIPRNQGDPKVQQGKQLFEQINCSGCHRPTLTTQFSPIEVLSFKEFHPYTDLLLHDMGSELDDKYTEGSAETYEWRTPPLWGLGLSPDSQGGQYFLLHDGRAKSIEQAIQLHGGEAEKSKNAFNELSVQEQEALLIFLESL